MDYTDNDNVSWRNQLSVQTEPVFTTIFTLEWVIKIVATGLIIGKGTYLSDPWNWIDFLVVISGLLTAVPQVENVSALRTFRLFRPLRSLSTLPNIRILIGTLLSSVAQLGGVIRRNYHSLFSGENNIYKFENHKNYNPPLKKNKVNHINKIIIIKFS